MVQKKQKSSKLPRLGSEPMPAKVKGVFWYTINNELKDQGDLISIL